MELFCAQYFVDGIGHLGPEESNHCIRVLRHREGDMIHLIDGEGTLLHCKILQARSFILRNPGIRVKEVAEVFGFKTPYHFSRIFLRETGSYPKKFTKADKPEE